MYVVTLCVLLLRYDVGVLFGTEIRQYWWENNAKFFAVKLNWQRHPAVHTQPTLKPPRQALQTTNVIEKGGDNMLMSTNPTLHNRPN